MPLGLLNSIFEDKCILTRLLGSHGRLRNWPKEMMKLLTSILASVCCTILRIKSGVFSFFKDKNFSMSRLASALKHTPAQSEAGKWVIMLRAFGYCFNKSVLVMRLQKNDSGEIRSNKLETILLRSLTAWTQSQTKHWKCQASLMDASACLKGT